MALVRSLMPASSGSAEHANEDNTAARRISLEDMLTFPAVARMHRLVRRDHVSAALHTPSVQTRPETQSAVVAHSEPSRPIPAPVPRGLMQRPPVQTRDAGQS